MYDILNGEMQVSEGTEARGPGKVGGKCISGMFQALREKSSRLIHVWSHIGGVRHSLQVEEVKVLSWVTGGRLQSHVLWS